MSQESLLSELNDRSREVFRRVVETYLQTGEPVGSRTLTRALSEQVSAATVRNVMQDLEFMGLLDSPHASAGRLPSQRGLRLFVDGMMEVDSVAPTDRAAIDQTLGNDDPDTGLLLDRVSTALSSITRGASLVLNEVETLHPPIRGIVGAIESALGARASANVYCSWQHHQAFDSHFDRHDVFALQVLGEKRWNIYAGRAEHPIEHAMFHNVPQATYDQMKGQVAKQVTMRPGDLIYLPRGQFHDAIATDAASIHVTFSATAPNGLDWLTQLWNEAVALPEFRAYLPRVEGSQDQETMRLHLQGLLQKLSQAALSPEAVARITDMRRNYRMLPPAFDLPDGPGEG